MKNKIKTIINVFSVFLLVFSIYKIIESKSYEYITEKRVLNIYNNSAISDINKYDEYIKVEGKNIDDKLIETLKINISIVPHSITDKFFKENNGKIILTSKNIKDEYYKQDINSELTGLYNSKNKIIYIASNRYAINDATIHEFGHVLDSLTGWTSIENKDIVANIYNEEIDTFETHSTDEYYKSNEREFLAQAFLEYILNKERLEENSPKTYKYIEDLIKSLEN